MAEELRILYHAAESDNVEEKLSTPEASLWAAVLGQVLLDLDFTGQDSKRIQNSARQWLSSSNYDIGSLRWIADFLHLSPSAVRKALLNRSAPVEGGETVWRQTIWNKASSRSERAAAPRIQSQF